MGWGSDGREVQEGRDICIHIADSHLQQKLTQHCTAIIFQLKKTMLRWGRLQNLVILTQRHICFKCGKFIEPSRCSIHLYLKKKENGRGKILTTRDVSYYCRISRARLHPCITTVNFYIGFQFNLLGFPGGSVVIHLLMQQTQETHWIGTISWRRKWKPTPAFLPGKSHGQRSLKGYSP